MRRGRLRDAPVLKPYSHPNEMIKDFEVIGHVPKLMALWLTKFPVKQSSRAKRVNRGGGCGLEVPCEYRFTGDSFSINWLKTKLTKEGFDVK